MAFSGFRWITPLVLDIIRSAVWKLEQLEDIKEETWGNENSQPNVLSEKSNKDEDVLYFISGNSGGCHPKCLLHDREGAWLVKFRHTYDPKDMGMMEYHSNKIAHFVI